jgi:predicted outer membrane repeat protein
LFTPDYGFLTINGPTITNCMFTRNSANRGGAMYFSFGSGDSTVTNCTFTGNSATTKGGGIYNDGTNVTIANCIFTRNSANEDGGGMYNSGYFHDGQTIADCNFTENSAINGGGMYNESDSLTMTDCNFTENSASEDGGGIYAYGNNGTITGCIFTKNSANTQGGGMANSDYSDVFRRRLTVTNCTFSGNSADYGGAMSNNHSEPTVTNCTFSGNSAKTRGGGIVNQWASDPRIISCILWGNAPDQMYGSPYISYSNIEDTWEGKGNIDVDPLFADIDNGDYHLQSEAGRWDPISQSWVQDDVASPCIDTGDPGTPVGDEPLPNGGIINMGAYGGTDQASKSKQGN